MVTGYGRRSTHDERYDPDHVIRVRIMLHRRRRLMLQGRRRILLQGRRRILLHGRHVHLPVRRAARQGRAHGVPNPLLAFRVAWRPDPSDRHCAWPRRRHDGDPRAHGQSRSRSAGCTHAAAGWADGDGASGRTPAAAARPDAGRRVARSARGARAPRRPSRTARRPRTRTGRSARRPRTRWRPRTRPSSGTWRAAGHELRRLPQVQAYSAPNRLAMKSAKEICSLRTKPCVGSRSWRSMSTTAQMPAAVVIWIAVQ